MNFMIARPTKLRTDRCFGLLKQKHRQMPVSCLADVGETDKPSIVTGVNQGCSLSLDVSVSRRSRDRILQRLGLVELRGMSRLGLISNKKSNVSVSWNLE
jgi:hypothetical protein